MKLREYQQLGIQLIKQAMIDSRREGKPRNTLLAAPCAYGKTITAAYLLKAYQDAGKRGIFICDRVKLVNQSIAAFGPVFPRTIRRKKTYTNSKRSKFREYERVASR
jgi:superfamily II DNA or RNA helicase